jgi:hypothetical protein
MIVHSSLSSVRVVKSRRLQWAGHLPQVGETEILVEKTLGNNHLEDQEGEGIILKCL